MKLNENEEVWKPIEGYEGRYEISNCGRVKSNNYRNKGISKVMKPCSGNKNYLYISLRNKKRRKTFAIHKLVLETFVRKKPKGKQAAHYDGNPQNNYVKNLRWATAKENIEDRKRHGRTARGEKAGAAKLDRYCVKTIKKLKDLDFSAYEIARLACVSTNTIIRIWSGETWRHIKP